MAATYFRSWRLVAAEGELATLEVTGVGIPAVLALVGRPGVDPALRELVAHCRAAFAVPDAA